jgi:hypothetical protein
MSFVEFLVVSLVQGRLMPVKDLIQMTILSIVHANPDTTEYK